MGRDEEDLSQSGLSGEHLLNMIFVTVGTHEQPFTRLVEYMDRWASSHDEEVLIQTGFTPYEPVNCRWQKLFPQQEVYKLNEQARIIVTHGGPSCYIDSLRIKKVPVVVPRRHVYGEHIDDHQLEVGREFSKRYGNIILIEDIDELGKVLENYDEISAPMRDKGFVPHSREFCRSLSDIVDKLF